MSVHVTLATYGMEPYAMVHYDNKLYKHTFMKGHECSHRIHGLPAYNHNGCVTLYIRMSA